MPKDSGTEKAQTFAEHLNESFPGAGTRWSGPPQQPARYVFDMPGFNKQIVIQERVFDLWGGSKPALQKALDHHNVDDRIAGCPAGSALHVVPGNGEKPEFETRTLSQY